MVLDDRGKAGPLLQHHDMATTDGSMVTAGYSLCSLLWPVWLQLVTNVGGLAPSASLREQIPKAREWRDLGREAVAPVHRSAIGRDWGLARLAGSVTWRLRR